MGRSGRLGRFTSGRGSVGNSLPNFLIFCLSLAGHFGCRLGMGREGREGRLGLGREGSLGERMPQMVGTWKPPTYGDFSLCWPSLWGKVFKGLDRDCSLLWNFTRGPCDCGVEEACGGLVGTRAG